MECTLEGSPGRGGGGSPLVWLPIEELNGTGHGGDLVATVFSSPIARVASLDVACWVNAFYLVALFPLCRYLGGGGLFF